MNKRYDGFSILGTQVAMALCAKHGEHQRQFLDVTIQDTERRTYPFCPYCLGEYMAEHFPVTEAPCG